MPGSGGGGAGTEECRHKFTDCDPTSAACVLCGLAIVQADTMRCSECRHEAHARCVGLVARAGEMQRMRLSASTISEDALDELSPSNALFGASELSPQAARAAHRANQRFLAAGSPRHIVLRRPGSGYAATAAGAGAGAGAGSARGVGATSAGAGGAGSAGARVLDLSRPGHGTGSLFATGRNTSFSDLHVVTGRGVGGGAGQQGPAAGARPRPGFRRVNTYDVPDSQDIPRAAAAFHRSQTLGSRHVRVAELQSWLPKRRNDWREGSTDSAMPSPQLVRRRSSLSRASSLSRSGSGVAGAQTHRIIRRRSLHGVPSHVFSRGLHRNRRASPTLDASGRLVHPRAVTSSRSPVAGLRAAALAHFADPKELRSITAGKFLERKVLKRSTSADVVLHTVRAETVRGASNVGNAPARPSPLRTMSSSLDAPNSSGAFAPYTSSGGSSPSSRMRRARSRLRDEVDISETDVAVHVRDMPCTHEFAPHRRMSLKTAPCAQCGQRIGRTARDCFKCRKCGGKVHRHCAPPRLARSAAAVRAGCLC